MPAALTHVSISKLSGEKLRREVADGKMRGLYLVIQPSGSKSWAYRYRVCGKSRKLTIGPFPAIDLATARRLAQRAASEAAEGKDPAGAKQAARIATIRNREQDVYTVGSVIDIFIARHARPNTRPSSAMEVERLLRKEAEPFWGDRPLRTVTRADVHRRLDELVDRGAPVMANRFLGVFRKMCGWALERGIIDRNPCEGIRPPTAEVSRDRTLSDDELQLLWIAADELGWPFGPIIQLLILTGQRRGEVTAMQWSEVDLEKCTWTIPKERSKNGIEHVVPLSKQALEVLKIVPTIKSQKGLVFTMTTVTPVSGHSRAKARLDALIAARLPRKENSSPFVLHDIRRTVASGMARLGIDLPVVEKVSRELRGNCCRLSASLLDGEAARIRRLGSTCGASGR